MFQLITLISISTQSCDPYNRIQPPPRISPELFFVSDPPKPPMITGTRHLRRCRLPSNSSARQRVINHIYPSMLACHCALLVSEAGGCDGGRVEGGGHRGFSLNSKPVINLGCVGVLRMTRLWVRNNIGAGGQVSQSCPVRLALIVRRSLPRRGLIPRLSAVSLSL